MIGVTITTNTEQLLDSRYHSLSSPDNIGCSESQSGSGRRAGSVAPVQSLRDGRTDSDGDGLPQYLPLRPPVGPQSDTQGKAGYIILDRECWLQFLRITWI